MSCYGRSSKSLGFYHAISRTKIRINPVSIVNDNNVQSSYTFASRSNPSTRITNNASSFSSSIVDYYRRSHYIQCFTSRNVFRSIEVIPFTNRKHENLVSNYSERSIGERRFKELKAEYNEKGEILPKMSPESVRVRRVLKDIVEALHGELRKQEEVEGVKWATSHLEGLKWEVLVVKKNDVRAFCLAGGKIIMCSGLLNLLTTDEQIATIIGHEVAHVVAGHVVDLDEKMQWFTQVKLILCRFVNEDVIMILYDLLKSRLSRRREIEADYIGILLMAYAGYNPVVAPEVYEKLGKVWGTTILCDYVSSHPWGMTRSELLSKASVMQQATSIYREAIARRKAVDTS